jgi:hypothetical protein
VALVAPCGTETLAGTVAAVVVFDRDTTRPPDGAADVRVIVPCADVPPATLVGVIETADSPGAAGGGVTVSVALLVVPP